MQFKGKVESQVSVSTKHGHVSLTVLDSAVHKSTDPDTKVSHVEDAKPVTIEHHEHLPRGLSQTGEEKEKKWFVGSIDQGTTSSRFLVFDGEGTPVASHQIEFENIYPESGWHEHDPMELLSSVQECIEKATESFIEKGHSKDQIKAIGITNQRETTVCWDTNTGEPLYNAVVWPDTRTTSIVKELKAKAGADELLEICGLPLSTYPSSVKLLWLLRNVDAIKQAYDEERLSFGTVDSWLIYKLNGGKDANIHITDSTNASRTMFMNLHTMKYDEKLLGFFDLDQSKIKLPKIVPSSDPEAYGKLTSGILSGTKITGCLGDQSAALVGQCGFNPGEAKNTYGTGCFLLYNVGEKPVISKHGLLATVAYDFGAGRKPIYALEGSIAVAGSGVKFLMNNLGFIKHSSKITELAETVKDNGGVVFVTAFSGLFAPYWIDDAKGTLSILDAMEKDSNHKLEGLAVDGADIIGIPVDRPLMRETTALGAAIAAGFAAGIWQDFSELKEINKEDRKIFKPQVDAKKSDQMFKKWEQAVQMCRGWVLDNSEE
ncbi:putative Glycerol kinase [Glarea lozoyensis 74030]|uniref:glycerol kinase n=1 Tax=Glarea lozoyensis (strain ATCC 74030 / MF5533) TaxID=1104152 RepID=H0ECJ9_GLAL7|nr:putative Glycerol kinase [Glarea lozoyensis 74030]